MTTFRHRSFVVAALFFSLQSCRTSVATDTAVYHKFDEASWAITSTNVSSVLNSQRAAIYQDFMENCQKVTTSCLPSEDFRLRMNRDQPSSVVNYTTTGFMKISTPPRVRKILETFWANNRDAATTEDTVAAYHNGYMAAPSFVNVADSNFVGGGVPLQAEIAEAVRETVEEWTGLALAWTSVYGIRIYHNNSILAPHVDRLPLVASVIIHIENDVDEDWPLEVYDHEGRAHNVSMKPWDMVLYESHSIIHGRPFALQGRYYANLFAHFEPLPKEGDSYDRDSLPPYLIPGSPWAEQWREDHPEGWVMDVPNAVRKCDLKALRQLVKIVPESIHEYDEGGWQPIHEAARFGDLDIIKLLIENGVAPDTPTKKGETVLRLAKEFNPSDHPLVLYLTELLKTSTTAGQEL